MVPPTLNSELVLKRIQLITESEQAESCRGANHRGLNTSGIMSNILQIEYTVREGGPGLYLLGKMSDYAPSSCVSYLGYKFDSAIFEYRCYSIELGTNLNIKTVL